MLHYVVTADHRHTIDRYLAVWAPRLARRLKVIPYERLRHQRKFAAGSYVFTDIDRIDPATRRWAGVVAAGLRAAGNRVLNDPARVLSRFDLLRQLHDAGRNDFCAYRESEWSRVRFPAFLRLASEHTGNLTPLLNDAEELAAAFAALPAGVNRDDVIAVEFIDTRDAAGVFRKYSVHRVGPHYIPRHVLFSQGWVGKYADRVGPDELDEEAAFVRTDAFGCEVRAAFELAGIEYGRIDFGVSAGRVQVWEINTNPRMSPEIDGLNPARFQTMQCSLRAVGAALGELAEHGGAACGIRVGRNDRRSYGFTSQDAVLAAAAGAWRKWRDTPVGRFASCWWSEYV